MTDTTPPSADALPPQAPARCIKPHCPTTCSGCNHAISSDDEFAVLVADLLLDAGVDGHGAPYEDGEHPVVDRARAFLRDRNSNPTYTHHEMTGEALRAYYDGLASGRQMLLDEQARAASAVRAAAPQPITYERIETVFKDCGGKWDGDQWVIEDADLHPFARAIRGEA